ncbi:MULTISPECIES: hypothetical protein [Lacticaseibacillus]|uniref:hypothetical protein n=1 Tax=Lacticaseibacillus TaxID=2759736 RepID=UPI001943175E|nr:MULTISPECIES: hypothetical protein [Lacticaseibacillus]
MDQIKREKLIALLFTINKEDLDLDKEVTDDIYLRMTTLTTAITVLSILGGLGALFELSPVYDENSELAERPLEYVIIVHDYYQPVSDDWGNNAVE